MWPSTLHRPLRVLHIVGNMNRGGTETWLMHALRRTDRARIQMDFVVSGDSPCHYGQEITDLGSQQFVCQFSWRGMMRGLQSLQHQLGRVDVVHSHMQFFNAIPLAAAARCGIPVRISHSHLDTRRQTRRGTWTRQFYERSSRLIGAMASTHRLGCSQDACASLFGVNWAVDPGCRVLHCGLDFQPFRADIDRCAARSRLGLRDEHVVFGHVGRFCAQKNQQFLLAVFAEIVRQLPLARLLLVGHGPDHADIESQIRQLGLQDAVKLLDPGSDVPGLLLGVLDAFVFPSLFEGLGLAFLEAQAAGLPCVISDRVPAEADVVKPLIARVPLEVGPRGWAEQCLGVVRHPRQISREESLAQVMASTFNIEQSSQQLAEIYFDAVDVAARNHCEPRAAA